MTDHFPECYLRQPCRSNDGGEHVMQGTVAGFPVTICGLCLDDCICEQVLTAFHRGWKNGVDWYKQVALDYGNRKYEEGREVGHRETNELLYYKGVSDAKSAVAALPYWFSKDSALAAISALEKP
jgi:hypothetical protein